MLSRWKNNCIFVEILTYCVNGEGGCAAADVLPLMKELVQMISAHYLCWRLICKDEM